MFLERNTKYVEIKDSISSISVYLDNIPPIDQRSIFKELLIQTLVFREFIKVLFEPIVKTHPPLCMRLRVLKTAFSETQLH